MAVTETSGNYWGEPWKASWLKMPITLADVTPPLVLKIDTVQWVR